jgi:anti-sigma factor RsiW
MAHLDGELSAEPGQSVSVHLETCTACQELVASLRTTSQSLSNWTVGSVSAGLENNVAKSTSQFGFAGSNRFYSPLD